MTAGVFPLPFAGPGDALERAAGAQRRVAQVEAEKVEHLATYLTDAAHDAQQMTGSPTSAGGERTQYYGGDGTPAIPEFVVCEIAAALGLAQRSAAILVGDVLDITHRLPMLYDSLQEGLIDLWRVRKVASATRNLSEVAARESDFRLAATNVARIPLAARVSSGRLDQILDRIRAEFGEQPTTDNSADNSALTMVRVDGISATSTSAPASTDSPPSTANYPPKTPPASTNACASSPAGCGNSATAAPCPSCSPSRPAGSPNPPASRRCTSRSSTTAG